MMQSVHFTRFDEYVYPRIQKCYNNIYIFKKKINGRPLPQYDLLYYYIYSMQSVYLTRFDAYCIPSNSILRLHKKKD